MATVTLQARPVGAISLKKAVQAGAAAMSSGECNLIGASITTVAAVASAFIPGIGAIVASGVFALGGAITAYACQDDGLTPEQSAMLAGSGFDLADQAFNPDIPDYSF